MLFSLLMEGWLRDSNSASSSWLCLYSKEGSLSMVDQYWLFSYSPSWKQQEGLLSFMVPSRLTRTPAMKKKFLLLIVCTALTTLAFTLSAVSMQHLPPAHPTDTTYCIIPSEASTYGYEILVNNKLLIRQQSIPGLPGNKGFATKADAAKTARLVIKKLQQGVMPPTITTRELDSMKIQLPHY
jgi:hypothetical protein